MTDHPHTREAMERWRQGKINVFDALAELEDQRDEARQALQEIANGDMRTSRARARQALGKTTHTPETDAAEMPIDRVDTVASRPCHIVNSEFARKLERERDQWRRWAERVARCIRVENKLRPLLFSADFEAALAEFDRLMEVSK